ncbi:hypothetical protein HK098_007621 [Nowakowskiella sp. JEL0407]|nr:hypothetical protein HK098_007621 [Nowakowskiella sp. JEL0407]
MGSYCSVHNNTNGAMYIKYGPNTDALLIAELVAGFLAAGFTGGASLAMAATALGITATELIDREVTKELAGKGFSRIDPDGTYTSDRLSLSLVVSAHIVLVEVLPNGSVQVKSGTMTCWSGPTDGSTNGYNATDCSFESQIIN